MTTVSRFGIVIADYCSINVSITDDSDVSHKQYNACIEIRKYGRASFAPHTYDIGDVTVRLWIWPPGFMLKIGRTMYRLIIQVRRKNYMYVYYQTNHKIIYNIKAKLFIWYQQIFIRQLTLCVPNIFDLVWIRTEMNVLICFYGNGYAIMKRMGCVKRPYTRQNFILVSVTRIANAKVI